jgi:PadR family transcriptional regulator, regulatory protein AphA
MALKHVLLGILSYSGPMAGYSLHKALWSPIRPALQQIYRTINEMLNEGLITVDRVDNAKQPTRNMCSITEKGTSEFKRWVMEHSKAQPMSEPITQQIVFSGNLDKKDIIANIEAYKEQRKNELLFYTSRNPSTLTRKLHTAPLIELCAELVREYMRRRGEAEIGWAREAIERINNYIPKSTPAAKKTKVPKEIHKASNRKNNINT